MQIFGRRRCMQVHTPAFGTVSSAEYRAAYVRSTVVADCFSVSVLLSRQHTSIPRTSTTMSKRSSVEKSSSSASDDNPLKWQQALQRDVDWSKKDLLEVVY